VAVDAAGPVTRRLVGDHEPAEAFVLTLAAGWPHTYEALLDALAAHGPVDVLVQTGAGMRAVRHFVDALRPATRARLRLVPGVVDSPWVRDYGPLQVRDASGDMLWLDAEYEDRPRDDAVPARLAARWSVPLEALPVSLDGGAIASDGRGHCVSTLEVLVAHGIDRFDPTFSERLLPALGCVSVLLVHALQGEDTGHVDMFLQFLDATTVAVSSIDADLDPDQAATLDGVVEAVLAFANRRGLPWQVVRVPMGMDLGGDLFPYVNGFRLPGTFLMPSYHDVPTATENEAAASLAGGMPGVAIVRIPAAEMADLGGALHCAVAGVRPT
jgi:agmatine deiminase